MDETNEATTETGHPFNGPRFPEGLSAEEAEAWWLTDSYLCVECGVHEEIHPTGVIVTALDEELCRRCGQRSGSERFYTVDPEGHERRTVGCDKCWDEFQQQTSIVVTETTAVDASCGSVLGQLPVEALEYGSPWPPTTGTRVQKPGYLSAATEWLAKIPDLLTKVVLWRHFFITHGLMLWALGIALYTLSLARGWPDLVAAAFAVSLGAGGGLAIKAWVEEVVRE